MSAPTIELLAAEIVALKQLVELQGRRILLLEATTVRCDTPGPVVTKKRAIEMPVLPPAKTIALPPPPSNGRLAIYCDGSCLGNGSQIARAGSGFVDVTNGFTWSSRCPGVQTNQRSELFAALAVMAYCRHKNVAIDVYSDSEYVVLSINEASRLEKWSRNGWRTASGTVAVHTDLWKEVILMRNERSAANYPPLRWTHVKAHVGIDGNETADKLATRGANLPVLVDWQTILRKLSEPPPRT